MYGSISFNVVDLNALPIVFTDKLGLSAQENAFTEYNSDLRNGLADIAGGIHCVKVRRYRLDGNAFAKDDQSIGRLNFFSEIAVDTVVNVDGAFGGSAITWQQVEIEN